MAVSSIVARGFGTFGGVTLVPTRGFGIGAPSVAVLGPYYFVHAGLYGAGATVGSVYCAGAATGSVYGAGAVAGQVSTQ